MSALASALAAKFIPMPTMRAVSWSALGIALTDGARLNAMTQPVREVSDRCTHMRRPKLVAVLLLEPRQALGKLLTSAQERCSQRDRYRDRRVGAAWARSGIGLSDT
jgi:hypothetical protein